jgi:ribosomal protein L11 methyltransferase
MLLEWLEGAIAGGERVLDIGTGSGILAMTALRLGARAALAVDHDPVAIECAAASAADNGFGQELDLHVADLGDLRGPAAYRADLVLANLDTRTFTTHAERFRPWLEAGARLFLSGMLAEDREAIEAAFARISGAVARCERREGWLAMELRRPEGREGAN